MSIKIVVKLKAGYKYDEDAGVFVTYAPALGIYSQGETIIQAKVALEDAVQSFFIVACKNKVLERCLESAGLSPESSHEKMCETGEYIEIKEAKILEEREYQDIFDVPASVAMVAYA